MSSPEEVPATSPGTIACEIIVARALNPEDLTKTIPRRVRKSAFIPRKNGNDNAGLSVTILQLDTLERLRRRLRAPRKEAVTLHVGHIREIAADHYRLDVEADPVDDDARHALITGFPARSLHESIEDKATWNRLAELLAAQARCCLLS